jgi:hypothetical protein
LSTFLGFEEAMRKREHEFRIQADEMSAKVLEHELKVKHVCNYSILSYKVVQRIKTQNSQQVFILFVSKGDDVIYMYIHVYIYIYQNHLNYMIWNSSLVAEEFFLSMASQFYNI